MDYTANPSAVPRRTRFAGLNGSAIVRPRTRQLRVPGPLACAALLFTLAASLARQTSFFQFEIANDLFLSVQFLMLMTLGMWSVVRLLTLRRPGRFPVPLLISGPLFFVFAVVVDSYRQTGSRDLLLLDALYVFLPILVAAGLVNSNPAEQGERFQDWLLWLLAGIVIIYMGVALMALSSDFGDFVATRYAYAERLPFQRLSGPLGGATSLGILLLPSLAIVLDRLRLPRLRSIRNLALAGIFGLGILWTGSQLHIALLIVFLATFFPLRWSVPLGLMGLTVLAYLGLDSSLQFLIPAKWANRGFTDPGRMLALETSLRAWLSDGTAFFFGVGSDRMNILSDTALRVGRGELMFYEWMTDFGPMPYGPHSILWWSLSSYGIFGALLRCAFLFSIPLVFIRAKALNWEANRSNSLPTAMLLSSAGFLFDDTHIVYPYLMMIWFFFYLRVWQMQRPVRPQ